MNNIRKTITAVMAVSMLASFVGCGGKTNASKKTEEKKGGYTEEDVSIDNSVADMSEILKAGDQLAFVDKISGQKYMMNSGDTGFSADNGKITEKLSKLEGIVDVSFGPSGECFVIYLNVETFEFSYMYIDKDGGEHQVTVDDMLINSGFTADGKLYAAAIGTLYEINTESFTSKEIMTVGNETVGFDIVGDNVVVVDELGAHFYDHKNNKETEASDVLSKFFIDKKEKEFKGEFEFDMCEGEDGSMYIVNKDGIYRYAKNGNQVEKILGGSACSVGNPSYHPRSIEIDSSGNILVGFTEGMVKKYAFDSEMSNKVTKKLKIYSLQKNDTLAQIINNFSAENKDIKIDYQVGLKNGMTYGDAMKDLTTQLLSGESLDLILLDGLDIKNLIDKNMLMDLSDSEGKWNSDGKLMDNIVKWNEQNSKLYSVACKFRIPAVGADKDSLKGIKSYSDVADLVEKTRKNDNGDYAIVYFDEPEIALKNALIYTGGEVITDKGIDKAKLTKMYEDCCKIYKNDKPAESFISAGGIKDVAGEYDFAGKLSAALSDPRAVALGTLNTFDCDYNLATSLQNYEKKTNVEARIGMTENSTVFLPTCNLGIVESSKEKETALKFINTALSEGQQKIDNTDGFPVNRNALEYFYNKRSEGDNDAVLGLSSADGSSVNTVNIEWIDEDEAKKFDEYIDRLDTPLVIDEAVADIIVQSGKKCLEGSTSPSEAADEAVKQLDLKMKE